DLYEDTEVATDFQDIPPEEMNEVLEYYKKNYRHSIEVHFMDYKGRGLDTFSNEQYQARVREIEEALDRLPIPPTVHMYGFESHTAVWEIPEQRRFLTEEEFYRMRDNFLKMISTIGISTPIPTEDYYDSELAYYNQPMAELYKYYHEKIKPLAEFDRISGLRICAEDKK
ncbi:hypothetical protein H7K32_25520, partial [Brevibacillus agri]|uniref:hypothetical protein n=3 Tax=Brevibacillus TaxID=55080 RepID=UPI001C8D54A6